GLFGPPGTRPFPNQQVGLDFVDYVLKEGRNAFDLFDLRLYGDPYTIVARVDFMRQKMLALGCLKPTFAPNTAARPSFSSPRTGSTSPCFLRRLRHWFSQIRTAHFGSRPPAAIRLPNSTNACTPWL